MGADVTELAKINPQPAPESGNMLSLIERVIMAPDIPVERLERLLEMQERISAKAAKEAFDAALAEMQTELPVISARGEILNKAGGVQSKYAKWEDVNDALRPVLSAHGFALSFRTHVDGDRIIVTGILSHNGGHREETSLPLPADHSGSKNAVQAIGSAVSYGKRYTAFALLNITSRAGGDADDDGAAAGMGRMISAEQYLELRNEMEEVGADEAAFCKHLKVEALDFLPLAAFPAAKAALAAKRRKLAEGK